MPFGEFLEFGAGVSYTSRTVPSIYTDFVDNDGREIEQDLKLRIAPITATIRLLPFGRSRAVQPYIGGGIGFFNYRYSEVGDFVTSTDRQRLPRQLRGRAAPRPGAVALAGIRFPVSDAGRSAGKCAGRTPRPTSRDDFLGTELDLGGFHYLATIHVKF